MGPNGLNWVRDVHMIDKLGEYIYFVAFEWRLEILYDYFYDTLHDYFYDTYDEQMLY